jgi:TPR repeat protein
VGGRRPKIPPDTSPILVKILQKGWYEGIVSRPSFAHIVKLLLDYDEPLFPGTDMTAYREYRQRVFAQTLVDPKYREVLNRPTVRDKDVPKFQDALVKAQAGDPEFQLRVGGMYERGYGVEQDFEAAFDWYLEAAKKGQSIAMVNVGKCYLTGTGTEASYQQSLFWLEKAAEDPKLPLARYNLGSLLFKVGPTPADRTRGFELLKAAADPPVNCPEAQYQVANAYEDAINGIPEDFAQARHYYELAARGGIEEAHVNLAGMELRGSGGPQNVLNGINILEQAAVKNVPMAICNLGEVYSNPDFGVVDYQKARDWFQRAVDLKYPHGLMKFAVFLHRRAFEDEVNQLELNRQSACYMRDAADFGNNLARTDLGKFLLEGIGVKVNVPEAKRILALAAVEGFPPAKVLLGQIFYEGKRGTIRDIDQAYTLWREAAVAGNPQAQELLRKAGQPL